MMRQPATQLTSECVLCQNQFRALLLRITLPYWCGFFHVTEEEIRVYTDSRDLSLYDCAVQFKAITKHPTGMKVASLTECFYQLFFMTAVFQRCLHLCHQGHDGGDCKHL